MSDEWVDPLIDNPWLRGEPSQVELQANEFGMGEFTFDPAALEQRENMQKQLKEYLKQTWQTLPELIPNLPQEIEIPDPDWTPYTSDILSTYKNDKAIELVEQLVDSGMGFQDALIAVEQEALENNWAMPMLNPGGRYMQWDGMAREYRPPAPTVDEHNRQAAAEAATEAGGKLQNDAQLDGWKVFADSGQIISTDGGETFIAVQPSNFDMDEFGDGATEYLKEREKEKRSAAEREAEIAEYADYMAPRYAIDVAAMERDGILGAKTDYDVGGIASLPGRSIPARDSNLTGPNEGATSRDALVDEAAAQESARDSIINFPDRAVQTVVGPWAGLVEDAFRPWVNLAGDVAGNVAGTNPARAHDTVVGPWVNVAEEAVRPWANLAGDIVGTDPGSADPGSAVDTVVGPWANAAGAVVRPWANAVSGMFRTDPDAMRGDQVPNDEKRSIEEAIARSQQVVAPSQNVQVPFNPETHYGPVNTLPDFNGPRGAVPRNLDEGATPGERQSQREREQNQKDAEREKRYAASKQRQYERNARVNERNQASRDRMNVMYQDMVQDYKRNQALPSKQQQRTMMMDEFLATFYRGGA